MRLEGWHIVIIIVIAILLFGAPKLPVLARSVGQSLRIFKSEVKQMKDENKADEGTEPSVEGRIVDPATPSEHSTAGSPHLAHNRAGATGSPIPPPPNTYPTHTQ